MAERTVQGLADHIAERVREQIIWWGDELITATRDDTSRRAEKAERALERVQELFAGGPDTPCRTTWPDGIECVEVPMADLRDALDGPAAPEEASDG